MQIELDEADERSLVEVTRSYRRAMLARGLTVDVSPDDVLRALVRREAETVSRPGHALFELHSFTPLH